MSDRSEINRGEVVLMALRFSLLAASAALVGVLVLGERLTALQATAFAIALAGVLLATLPAAADSSR